MRLIGLTGGIATGKSTVASMLADRGAVLVDADSIAHDVLSPGAAAFEDVVALFGANVLDDTGSVDRTALGGIVFADPALRAELERITHPRIQALMQQRIVEALDSTAPLVVADIPLLFEREREGEFPGVMLVYAPPAVQLRRIADRDGLDDLSARRRLAAQLPIDVKRNRATWVIDNSGSRASTAAQVETWWHEVVPPG
jgi:dephospho-CoA kinase